MRQLPQKSLLVTAVEKTKKGRFSIFCEGEFVCALHIDIFAASNLTAGASVTEEELAELKRQSELLITKDRALRLLSARAYTSSGLCRKLLEYTDEDSAETTVARMIEIGLVDDLDYARRFAEYCVNGKGFSSGRIKQALREKGIDRDIIEQVLEEREDDPELVIAGIVLRKYARYLDDEKGAAKTVNALTRLGYKYSDIRRVLENLGEDMGYYDE